MKLNKMISLCPRRGFDFAVIAAMVLAVMAAATNVHADTVLADFTFDADLEGWTGIQCPGLGLCALTGGVALGAPKFAHNPVGGNPGGNVEGIDPGLLLGDSSTVLAVAPGTLTSAIAPDLWYSFDLKINGLTFDNDSAPAPFTNLVPLFYIAKGANFMVYAVPEVAVLTAPDFNEFSIPIRNNSMQGVAPGQWYNLGGPVSDTDFANFFLLGGSIDLLHWLELTLDTPDVDGAQLDNVKLVMHMPVPIPAALPLLLSALAGLGFIARRRV